MSPFKTLGVPDTATLDEIKKAYKKLAVQHHPDKGGDAEKFKQITTAYEKINSEDKLRAYKSGSIFNDADFDAIFGEMFKHHRAQPARKNIFVGIALTLEEMFQGGTKTFNYAYPETCKECGGVGATAFDRMGRAKTVCTKCHGRGSIFSQATAEVEFPRSVAENSQLVSKDRSVFANVQAIPHPKFTRRNFDIYSEVTIPLIAVFSDAKMTVDTLHGPIEVQVPRCIQPEQLMRIRGKGLFDFRKNDFADHIIKVRVTIPILSEQQCQKIVECLDDSEKETKSS